MSGMKIVKDGQDIGIAFIGASIMARDVVGPIVKRLPGVKIRGIYSSSYERGAEFAKANDIPKAYKTLEEAVQDDSVQAVYISTTNDLHRDQTIAAARAGKHILCEKPLTLSIKDAEEMVKAADEAKVVFATLLHQPALPQYRLVKDLVAAGKIGTPLAVRICHTIKLPPHQHSSWRTNSKNLGGGVLFDLTSHDADLVRFLLNDEIEEIYARGYSKGLAAEGIADNVMGVMHTRGGIPVSFHDSYMISNSNGFEVLGTEGVLTAREHGPYASIPAKEITLSRSHITSGSSAGDIEVIPVEDQTKPFERSIQAFVSAMRGEGEVIRSGLDGAKAVAIIVSALVSSESGRAEKVPEILI